MAGVLAALAIFCYCGLSISCNVAINENAHARITGIVLAIVFAVGAFFSTYYTCLLV